MMLEDYTFVSSFAECIEGLIEQKHASGYIYDSAKYKLIEFDRFCSERSITDQGITKDLSDAWMTYKEHEGKLYRNSRMSVLRQLALYMVSQGIECYIPSRFTFREQTIPYVLNDDEIRAFIQNADAYRPKVNADRFNALAEEYRVLFRLIVCCGLRVSEARKLKLSDIDFDKGTAVIHHTKGDKDRLIYIAEDVCRMCRELVTILRKKYELRSEYLFPSSNPFKPLQVASINKKFKEFWERTPYSGNNAKHPTVHSLRYSFVVSRMNRWMENDEDLNSLMPYLSQYLGHSSTDNTYYYYHQIQSAFKIVRQKDTLSDRIIPEVAHEE